MSSFTLVINSSNVSNANTNASYQYNFIGGGFQVTEDMEVMLSSAQIPYSINNITTTYNNKDFTFYFPSGSTISSYTAFPISIPDGFYTIDDLNSFMQYYALAFGLYLVNADGNNVYYTPTFTTNQSYYAVEILLYTVPRSLPTGWTQPSNWAGYSTFISDRTSYITILSTNNFGNYIGFLPGNYPPNAPSIATTSNYSIISNKKPPLITNVNSIIVHCSLVNNPVVVPSDILDAFQISNVSFGANINYAPTVEKYVKLTRGNYSSMILYLTDQNNNPITLIDPNILITLLFRKTKKL